ncbi:MAG: hypothetical protein HZB51_17715 [Chloroflexi bacterium]|nr:hypothetical protein [Chloroflexota bacterium]
MSAKPKIRARTIKEIPSTFESSNEQYLPIRDKATALDTNFQDPGVKHYGLARFSENEKNALDLWQRGNKFYLHCLSRNKKVVAKPEEIIRQLCLKRLLAMDCSLDHLSLEVPIKMGNTIHSIQRFQHLT